jgi:hypothetical protein
MIYLTIVAAEKFHGLDGIAGSGCFGEGGGDVSIGMSLSLDFGPARA